MTQLVLRLPNRPAQRSVTPVAFRRFTVGAGILKIRAVFAPSFARESGNGMIMSPSRAPVMARWGEKPN
jgi:hypothetical protein